MCKDCGCGQPGPTKIDGKPAEEVKSPIAEELSHAHFHHHGDGIVHSHPHVHAPGHEQEHEHVHEHHAHEHLHSHEQDHDHPHDHEHPHTHPHTVDVRQSVLSANDRMAERNRGYFQALGLLVLNVVSSPGSGKTTFIQKTVLGLGDRLRSAVIVGDLETDNDANRLRAAGATAVQITTGTLCHLEAGMVARAVGTLDVKSLGLLIIENVGNLVCPASFDLGESLRVVLLSVTEGEDKPLKYPPIFHAADVVIVTKLDLSDAVEFNRELALKNLHHASPKARIFEVSAKTGAGMQEWCDFLLQRKNAG
ncbi:MAG: hydrogenase nickel incorporation protein HypB [Verrucomicrobiota bacterium]